MSTFGLVWSNLFRHRVRTMLTLLSVIVAFLLFALLRSVAEAMGAGIGVTGADRLVVSPKYSIIDPLPVRLMNEIAAVPGVMAVTHADWFGGHYRDPANFFPKFPVRPRDYFAMYPEYVIDPGELEAFERTRTGAVASRKLAEKYGWKVGDKIPIEADIWPQRDGSRLWVFDLVGIYGIEEGNPEMSEFLINYEYFDEARQFGEGGVGWFLVRVADPDRAAEVARAIDARFANSANETRTATEEEFARQFANQVGDIGLMVTGILGAVFFTILLLTGNTMAQAMRERTPELGVLKTLGFTDGAVGALVLGEAVLLTVLGAALGLGVAALLAPGIAEAIGEMIPFFAISPATIIAGIALAAGLGMLVGAGPALAARRLSIVEALRER